MKVFRVSAYYDDYQVFAPAREEEWEQWLTDGTSRVSNWSPPVAYVPDPQLPASDFYGNNDSTLITSPRATQILRPFLELAGEILPLPYQGETYGFVNVTVCVDALDEDKTQYFVGPTGLKLYITRYAFDPQRLPVSPLFKLPRSRASETLVSEGLRPPEEEFRAVTLREHLVGLRFELLWSDDEESVQ